MCVYTHTTHTHTHRGILFSYKQEWNLAIDNNTDGPWGYHAKSDQSGKDEYCMKESERASCSVVSNSLQPHGPYSPWNSPGLNIGVGSLSLLQGIFPTQGSNPGLSYCRWILYQLSHKGSPIIPEWVAYPFSRGSSWPRNWTRVCCIIHQILYDFTLYVEYRNEWTINTHRQKEQINGYQRWKGLEVGKNGDVVWWWVEN